MADEGGLERSTRERWKDGARSAALGAAGYVPIVGPMLTELLDVAMPRIFERRVNTLLREVDARIGHLEVVSDETAATVLAIAAQAAITSDDEKIAYLADAVANAATGDEWVHDSAAILLRLVADLTATHLRVLDLLADPTAWITRTGVLLDERKVDGVYRFGATIAAAFENAGSPIPDTELVLNDLAGHGLFLPETTADGDATRPPYFGPSNVSALGHRLRDFITWGG